MPQNLPIQGPQVMEIQGGMRLTPLGLRQLGGLANQVVVPTGGPAPQTAAGSGATVVIDPAATAPIEPAQIAIFIPDQAHTGTGTYSLTLADYGFSITSIQWLVLTGGHGSGTNDVTIMNAAAVIGVFDLTSSTAGLYLDADKLTGMTNPERNVIAKGGVLNIEVQSGGAASKCQGVLTLTGFVMP